MTVRIAEDERNLPVCPNCKHTIDGATCLGKYDENIFPKEGDFSVCFYCGYILKFAKDLKPELVENSELGGLPSETRRQIFMTRRLILERLRQN